MEPILHRDKPRKRQGKKRMKTIADEIRELKAEARRLGYEIRNPRACPRLAHEAEERQRMTLEKIADLEAKATEATQP